MSLEARIEALKEKHAHLEMKIDEENSRPMPDDALVHTLKREKLHLKDEIERLMH
ncbi:YdcH family protein [Hwanghaeella sp.]|uniref:YdcH family protein n=1 Tax=Hwanghaeella sp. TaxID=2605943 RepID=UPI003CCB88C2